MRSESVAQKVTSAVVKLTGVVKTYKVGDVEVPAIRDISLEIHGSDSL
jgi:hypothetical protein